MAVTGGEVELGMPTILKTLWWPSLFPRKERGQACIYVTRAEVRPSRAAAQSALGSPRAEIVTGRPGSPIQARYDSRSLRLCPTIAKVA